MLPVVKAWSEKSFTGNDRQFQINDAISSAWEIFRTAPADTLPTKIAYFSIKKVKSNRQVSESVKCPLSSKRHSQKPVRCTFETALQARDNANPARVVAFKIDFQQWLAELNPRGRQIAELLAMGHETYAVAEILGVTPGAVSQWRRRLEDSWYATR